jgi:hypothetical protein
MVDGIFTILKDNENGKFSGYYVENFNFYSDFK